MIAKLVDRSAQSERRLRGLDGPRLQAERRTRRLQDDRRREDVDERCCSSTTTPAAVDLAMDSRNPQRALRRDVAGAARAVEADQRRPGQRPLQDDRRRRALDEDFRAIRASRPARSARSASRSRRAIRASSTRSCRRSDGGVFRSNDGGATWKRVNGEMKLRQRAFYYTAIFADPTNPQVAYVPQVDGVFKTKDGGKTFTELDPPHGDNHIIWINPRNPKILLEGNDGGGDRLGRRRRDVEQRAQSADRANTTTSRSTISSRSTCSARRRTKARSKGRARRRSAASVRAIGTPSRWARARSSRPNPAKPVRDVRQRLLQRVCALRPHHRRLKNVSPWPRYMSGATAAETKYRFGWTHPDLLLAGRSAASCSSPRKSYSRARITAERGRSSAPISRATIRAPKGRAAARSTPTKPARRPSPTSRRSRSRRSTPTSSGPARPTGWCT